MTNKPDVVLNFIAWTALIAGLYYVSAAIFGVVYLIVAGAGAQILAYAFPLFLGAIFVTAGLALIQGKRWSRWIFLALFALAALSILRNVPTLLLLALASQGHMTVASAARIAVMLASSSKWALAAGVATYLVFRHFRLDHARLGPTLDELSTHGSRQP